MGLDFESLVRFLTAISISVALAGVIAKMISRPTELRLSALEENKKEAEVALMTARKEIAAQLADIRDRYVKQEEMADNLTKLDKSLDEAKKDIREIRNMLMDVIRELGKK